MFLLGVLAHSPNLWLLGFSAFLAPNSFRGSNLLICVCVCFLVVYHIVQAQVGSTMDKRRLWKC